MPQKSHSFSEMIRRVYDISKWCELDRIRSDDEIEEDWTIIGITSDVILRRLSIWLSLFYQQIPLCCENGNLTKPLNGFEEEHADLIGKMNTIDGMSRQRILELYGGEVYSRKRNYRLFKNPASELTSILAWAHHQP